MGSSANDGMAVNMQADGSGITDPTGIVNQITQNLNSNGIDGSTILKTSVSSQNIPSSQESSSSSSDSTKVIIIAVVVPVVGGTYFLI